MNSVNLSSADLVCLKAFCLSNIQKLVIGNLRKIAKKKQNSLECL